MNNNTITIIPGDGIGYEIMDHVLDILKVVSPNLNFDIQHAGKDQLESSNELIPSSLYQSLEKNKVALKGPVTTPIGSGFKSINVSLRKKYDLYANVRKIKSFEGIPCLYNNLDIIIFRQNTEGLYIGEEEVFATPEGKVIYAKKKVSEKECYRIIRSAFEYAKDNGRKKITCLHKANILKLSDGLFLEIFNKVALEYPNIEANDLIIDNACMQLVSNPYQFDVIVTLNLYGDIISDLAAGLVGGLGIAFGANLGNEYAVFEAVHGSAPDIAGMGLANPLALLLSATYMLEFLNLNEQAKLIENAIILTLKENKHLTKDLGGNATSKEFKDAIIYHLMGDK